MQIRSIRYSKAALSVFAAVCLTSVLSCKDESNPAQQQISMSEPTLFIPVGLLKSPQGIAVDGAGNVWVSDSRNNKMRRFSANATQNDSIIAIQPTRIAIHRQNGDLLVIQNGSTYARYLAGTNTLVTSPRRLNLATSTAHLRPVTCSLPQAARQQIPCFVSRMET